MISKHIFIISFLDSYAKDVIESIEDKEEDKIIRETAAVVLSKLQHNEDVLKQDRMLDMAMSRPTDMSHQLFIKILELISFDKLEKSTLLKILEVRNIMMACFRQNYVILASTFITIPLKSPFFIKTRFLV